MRIRHRGPSGPFRLVAGVDAAFSPDERWCVAACVLWDAHDGVVVERRIARGRLRFPYVPGLLSFRETPAVLAALRRLSRTPDAILCDAHGYAHPRRFGLACHVGLISQRPTIGCGKSVLVGSFREPGPRRGARAPLRDGREVIGLALRTHDNVRPVFVSVGHRIDLITAARVVLACACQYRLPEPTRLADQMVRNVAAGVRGAGAADGRRGTGPY